MVRHAGTALQPTGFNWGSTASSVVTGGGVGAGIATAGGKGAGFGVATRGAGAGGIGAGFGGLVAQAESKATPISRLARNNVTGEDGLRQQMIMSEVWMPD